MTIGLLIVANLVIVAVLWLAFGALRRRSRTKAAISRLRSSRRPPGTTVFHEMELEGLPPPVARYFRVALRDGQPIVTTARLTQRGQFRTGDAETSWRPFSATEIFVPSPPGFLWVAQIRMALGLGVDVRDSYLDGSGAMRADLLGLFTVANASGTPEMAAGALQRYLAEAPWFPTALLPSQGVHWSAIDPSTARATLTAGNTTVSLDFAFNDRGEITRAFTLARFRAIKGGFELAPWGGRFEDYAERDGMRIPLQAEVAWVLHGQPFPYWRGKVISAEYETTP